jgi:hypothetical protein
VIDTQTEHLSWSYLLAIPSIITVQIGRSDPSTAGRELQVVITGV